jgi:hypothetical protein
MGSDGLREFLIQRQGPRDQGTEGTREQENRIQNVATVTSPALRFWCRSHPGENNKNVASVHPTDEDLSTGAPGWGTRGCGP